MKIAVVYSLPTKNRHLHGGFEAEDDTRISAERILESLRKLSHTARLYPVGETDLRSISSIRADLIFNLIEWTGADLPLAVRAVKLIQSTGIPYTGADPDAYHTTTDKILMKRALVRHGIPTAKHFILRSADDKSLLSHTLSYPLIVKLATEHSGIGLGSDSVVSNREELKKTVGARFRTYGQALLIEEYIDGREFEVGLVEDGGKIVVFPPAENIYSGNGMPFLTYESRWNHEVASRTYQTRLATLSGTDASAIKRIAMATFTRLHLRDYARLDMRLPVEGKPMVLEANSNPGIDDDPGNGLVTGFRALGYTLDTFLAAVVGNAYRRGETLQDGL